MKNLIIISCYVNTDEKKSVLINYINQLKKLSNFDIMLVSHIPMSESIINLVNYFIYDSDNFLFPIENTPVVWFRIGDIEIKMTTCRHGYAFLKNVHNALNFAKSLKYNNFIFSDYDNILNDVDLDKIQQIPVLLKNNDKKLFFFKDYNSPNQLGYAYESKFFAGDVNFFIDNFPIPISYEEWSTTEPFRSSSNIVEDLLANVFKPLEDKVYTITDKVNEYFSNSDFDVFHHFDYKNTFVYNLQNPSRPLFFCITPHAGEYELILNNNTAFKNYYNKADWLLHFIDVDENDTELIFKRNNEVVIKRTINIKTFDDIKEISSVRIV